MPFSAAFLPLLLQPFVAVGKFSPVQLACLGFCGGAAAAANIALNFNLRGGFLRAARSICDDIIVLSPPPPPPLPFPESDGVEKSRFRNDPRSWNNLDPIGGGGGGSKFSSRVQSDIARAA